MELSALIRSVVGVIERLDLSYFITGSIASIHYGEHRLTNDVDIVVRLPMELVEPFCAAFPPPEFYVSIEAARQAIAQGGQFNILQPATGLKVDIMVPKKTFYDHLRFSRAVLEEADEGWRVRFCAPEDVILKKMEYYKEGRHEKHLRDITGMLMISGPRIDRNYIEYWAGELGVRDIWHAILTRIGGAPSE
jgi:hypothetical protein